MTDLQKQVIRNLLNLCYQHGFCSYSLKDVIDIEEKLLFNRDTEDGLLYDIAQFGKNYVEIERGSIRLNFDLRTQLERWSGY